MLNLINEMDLTDFITSSIYENSRPASARMIADINGNFMPSVDFVGQAREIMWNFDNREFIANNKEIVAQFMI